MMFERYLINKKIHKLLFFSLELRKLQSKKVKEKLSFYKRLLKNPDQEVMDQTLKIIKDQEFLFLQMEYKMMKFEPRIEGKLTKEFELVVLSLEQVKSLLKDLKQAFYSQKSFLENKNLSGDEKIKGYRTYFKEELKVYTGFEALLKTFSPDLLHTIEEELIKYHKNPLRRLYRPNIKNTAKAIILTYFLIAMSGYVDADIKQFFDEHHTILAMSGAGLLTYLIQTFVKNIKMYKK